MQGSVRIGRIAGIEIGIHYSWLFAAALVAWSLAQGFFPSNYPGWSEGTYWLTGTLAALALFASVLLHELSHSLVALALGHQVHSITLFIFGGVSNLVGEAKRPWQEFLISIVGPLSSFALAGMFWVLDQALGLGASPVGAVIQYLAVLNVILGAFNLLPGFPLDGGRVARSIIWAVSGSLRTATNAASYLGQAIGFLLVFWGVFQVLNGGFLNGLWTAFIGWFLNNAAESVRQQQDLTANLAGVRVGQLMNPDPPIAEPGMSVEEFVFQHVLRQGQRALLVAEGGRLLGIVSISDAKKLPQHAWAGTPLADIMTPVPLRMVAPETELSRALELLVEGTFNQVPVARDGMVVGLLSRADILRFLQLRDELAIRRLPRRREVDLVA
jgi:Zn-dependent protease/CBS domain-containing protein